MNKNFDGLNTLELPQTQLTATHINLKYKTRHHSKSLNLQLNGSNSVPSSHYKK